MTYDEGCHGTAEPYEDLYYGNPSSDNPTSDPNYTPPQECDYCEVGGNTCKVGNDTKRGSAKYGCGHDDLPGHESLPAPFGHCPFKTCKGACTWLKGFYPHAPGDLHCHYYAVPCCSAPCGCYYVVMMKENPPSGPALAIPHYFGVETGRLNCDVPEWARFRKVIRRGMVLSFEYRVTPFGEWRQGLALFR